MIALKRMLIVGGTFDTNGGKPSKIVELIAAEARKYITHVTLFNGGSFKDLSEGSPTNRCVLHEVAGYHVVLWMPNVPNDQDKVRNVKEINPHCLLVTTKRNDDDKYSLQEMINHALGLRSNMFIEIKKINQTDTHFYMRLFDPLGNVWGGFTEVSDLVQKMMLRLYFMASLSRQSLTQLHADLTPKEMLKDEKFIKIVQHYAQIFHEIIHPAKDVNRFLGNSSLRFRCEGGFPSCREREIIHVTSRNMDKREITVDSFVPVIALNENLLYYLGEKKPSVDTPIHVKLYETFSSIKYLLHSHVYIKDAPFTKRCLPCGALEEAEEVKNAIYKNSDLNLYAANQRITHFQINLLGHGSIVGADCVDKLKDINYIPRPLPEVQG